MSASSFSPEARTSCARCHKRKKRCDRVLPACKNCQLARVRCSFLDNESQTTASYPIAYVRTLEARVQVLEQHISTASSTPQQAGQSEPSSLQGRGPDQDLDPDRDRDLQQCQTALSSSLPNAAVSDAVELAQNDADACDMFLGPPPPSSTGRPDDEITMAGGSSMASITDEPASMMRPQSQPQLQMPQQSPYGPGPASPQLRRRPRSHAHSHTSHTANSPSSHVPTPPQTYRGSPPGMGPPPPPPPPAGQSPSFAQELKSLSLEAAAERHVGSSSGVSFAKLTQMILCRLTPDKADFVFSSEPTAGMGTGAVAAGGNGTQTTTAMSGENGSVGDLVCGSDPQLVDFDSPSDLFNSSVLHSLGESISVYPLLFGDVFLTDIIEPSAALSGLSWPPTTVAGGIGDDAHIGVLVDFYFAHSNTLYPIIVRSEFMATLQLMREDPQAAAATLPALSLFRIWMVLAIGATAFSSVSLTEESEPMLYYNKALQYSEQALALDEMAALEVLTLQVSYSFFNQLGPNTWFLVGMSARVALGLGLHTAATYEKLPVDVAERRKRIFFSIYMMDRVVSIALGRPFALHDDDIDVTPFAAVDDDCITPEQILPQSQLQPSIMCVPLHILALRQIASRIARQVYSSSASRQAAQLQLSAAQRESVLTALHQELIDWRRNMPFPLPDVDSRVPHLSSTWYDFNYYTHLASIYRPSPLFPVMDAKRVKILESAAAMAVRHAYNLHQQRRFAYNWLNFLSLFTATLSLIYATTAQPDSLACVLRETRAIDDLELAIELFGTLSVKFSAARKIRGMIAEICKRYRDVKDNA
ncbi:c6 zinc finger domain containing protein [Grosmannia clavigera kw1407]|uniref:C6 zinc finger domain containing protein n=1 Tax=Grosmannia clavigera (strain kw1407 / UAMH 11150) TaxID=655863 RepID=F0XMT3_GROCL|nr:c6 zinc finger domain containing protein [Grosmannia clavigera kw1407]EFX01306.1 c6 zinc finger domain containing protein [Grosmannia clavigera kw1407]